MSRSLRLILVPALAVLLLLMVPGGPVLAQGRQAAATVRSSTVASPSTPTSVRCTTSGHQNPCWAYTQRDSEGSPWCATNPESHTSEVPVFSGNTLVACFASPDLVEISCYYLGTPVAYGDNYEDHVIAEYSGGERFVGHIPDYFVNLGDNNPPNVHIPVC